MAIRVNGDFYISSEGCPVLPDKSVTVEKISSGSADSGDVLTADGSGGVAFESIIQMPDPTNAEAGEVLTADGDGDAAWTAPYGKWIKLSTQPTVTVGAPVVNYLAELDFPTFEPGLSVEWHASVIVMDNPNSVDLTALKVDVVSGSENVFVSKDIGEDATNNFSGAFSLSGKFTVVESALLGNVCVGEAQSFNSTIAATDNGLMLGAPSGAFAGSEKLRLTALKPVHETGLQLKVAFFGYRVV